MTTPSPKYVDTNVIDDGLVEIVHKDEIEGKLADNYIVVGGTITKENVIDDSKVGIVHEDDEENLDKLDTELGDNSIHVIRTIITEVDANVIDDNIVGIGHEDSEGNEDELDTELADNYSFVDRIIIKVDVNAIDDSIVGNGHEDDEDKLDKELADNYIIVDRVIIEMNAIFFSIVNYARWYVISFFCFRKPDES